MQPWVWSLELNTTSQKTGGKSSVATGQHYVRATGCIKFCTAAAVHTDECLALAFDRRPFYSSDRVVLHLDLDCGLMCLGTTLHHTEAVDITRMCALERTQARPLQ
jgi:hypothetical protein